MGGLKKRKNTIIFRGFNLKLNKVTQKTRKQPAHHQPPAATLRASTQRQWLETTETCNIR
jgi:hypothetical protein